MVEGKNFNIKAINFRMPVDLHKVLKSASIVTNKSINRVILELIIEGFPTWSLTNLTELSVDAHTLLITEENKKELFENIGKVFSNLQKQLENGD